MGKQETLETIWEVPDELWERVEPIILRQMLNGIIFRLRSGCQWNRAERASAPFIATTVGGDGCLAPTWGALVEGCESWMAWTRQSADAFEMGKVTSF